MHRPDKGIMNFNGMKQYHVIESVLKERDAQDDKWGEQNHDRNKWLAILMEEVGEAARGALEGDKENYRAELIQVAAVAVAMVESLDRGNF